MKPCKRLFALSVVTWFALALIPRLAAQTHNADAVKWFSIGVQEKDAPVKIVAYKKALSYDSLFVEAWYNLGMTHKKRQEYAAAEQCLRRALLARPEQTKNELKAAIAYELATTYKKTGNTAEYLAHLRQAQSFTPERKLKIRIALDLGRILRERGEYESALAELRTGQELEPDNQDLARQVLELTALREAQRLYDAALVNLNGGKLNEAKALFAMIQAQTPSFKDAAQRIAELDSLLVVEKRKQTLALALEQAQKHEAEGRFEAAAASYENLLQQNGNDKDVQARLAQARTRWENKQREEKTQLLEKEYAAGAAALKKQDWTGAIIFFKRIVEADQNFRDARGKLAEAQSGLTGESLNATVARYYEEGLAAQKRNNAQEALSAFEKVRLLSPNYRDVAGRLAELAAAMPSAPSEKIVNAPAAASATSPLDSLYHRALALMVKEQWQSALETLAKLQSLQPDYRDVAELQARAQTHVPQAQQDTAAVAQVVNGKQHTVLLLSCGFVLALLALYFLLAPTTRARLLLWRGKHKAAEQIYEKLLARDPQQTSFYPVLADLYLRAGRGDEAAMRVYRRALQLDLPERKRKALRDFVMLHHSAQVPAKKEELNSSHAHE